MSTRITIMPVVLLSIAACGELAREGQAAPITWIGGNADWNAANANWNPADEPDANDEAIFNTPNTVDMANSSDTIGALTLSGGIDLNTNGNDLTVDGLIQLAGAGTNFFIGGNTSTVVAEDVTVAGDATLRMTGGTLTVVSAVGNGSVTINAGGTLSGNGIINLNDAVGAGTILLTLSGGSLNVTSTAAGDPFGTAAARLVINVSDADARVDLDNVSAVTSISRNDTLEINGLSHGAADPYSGTLNLGEGATIDMGVAWEMDSGTINANTTGLIVGSAGSAANIAGAAFAMNGGAIDLDALDSLRFSSTFLATGGTIANAGHVIFNANSLVGAGADFQMTGAAASITVSDGVSANIDDANFDADGTNSATNIITVNSGGVLDLDLGAGADETLGGTINLNGGELDVTTASNAWAIDRAVNVGANTGTSQINGEQLTITSATITVGVDSTLVINAPNVWGATGNLVTSAGGVTRLSGTTTFSGNGTFTGAGTLRTGGNTTFDAVTTINMPSGTVDLDGTDLIGNNVTINENTTINAGAMSSFGAVNLIGGDDTLVLNLFASLTVNLTDPDAEWTLTSNGVLDINAIGGMLAGSGIQGSDFNMAGMATISGNSLWGARTDISGTATVAAGGSLNLRGGDLTAANVNRLISGTITGAGALRSLVDEGLFGFGTIATDIEFLNNTELRADDGILNVNAPIVDVGVIGTADVDGILNVAAAWNSSVANSVQMAGGEIRGATITNGGAAGINGHGLLSAAVINNTRIDAEGGGTLTVQTAANNNDWDGAANTGQLNAISGNLEVRDNVQFFFLGSSQISADRELFINGFDLRYIAGSLLTMAAGSRLRGTASTDFGGTLTVAAGAAAEIQYQTPPFGFFFASTSDVTINGTLRVANSRTTINPGAVFSGGGSLVNPAGSALRLIDDADVDVVLQNQGTMDLDADFNAQVTGLDFQQDPSGVLQMTIGGDGLAEFDRISLTGAASLAGSLELSLNGGFVPSLLDSPLTIISAPGGVTGQFTSVMEPLGLPAGLLYDVFYSTTLVQLVIVNAPIYSADFDLDGDVDGDDLDEWTASFGVDDGADSDNDGDSDGTDFLAWQQQLGSVPVVPAWGAVPEPASILLSIVATAGLRRLGGRKRQEFVSG